MQIIQLSSFWPKFQDGIWLLIVYRTIIFQNFWADSCRPLADFLPTLIIKAKDFATELTSHNVVDKDLSGDKAITGEACRKQLGGPWNPIEAMRQARDSTTCGRRKEGSETNWQHWKEDFEGYQ